MAYFGAAYWFTPLNCLDAEFDALDEADHELCCAVVAGKAGLHPDAWGNHDPLTTLPLRFRRYEPAPRVYHPAPIDRRWDAQHRQRPPTEAEIRWAAARQRPDRSDLPEVPKIDGEVQLTCDECRRARFHTTVEYTKGRRDRAVAAIRALGRRDGWTCIVGRDRCPKCSQFAPPEPVGNGAGKDDGHEQHADGG